MQEKEWLKKLANQIQTYISKDSSSQNHLDITLSVLECLTNLKTKAEKVDKITVNEANNAVNYDGSEGERVVDTGSDNNDDSEARNSTLFELLCIADLIKSKEITAGQMVISDNRECIPSSLEEELKGTC